MNDQSNVSFFFSEGEAIGLFSVPNDTGSPERRLLLAVLERAILDFVGNDERERDAAAIWLFEPQECADLESPLTFIDVCEGLDLEAMQIRKAVRAMPRRGDKKIAPWYFTRLHNKAA